MSRLRQEAAGGFGRTLTLSGSVRLIVRERTSEFGSGGRRTELQILRRAVPPVAKTLRGVGAPGPLSEMSCFDGQDGMSSRLAPSTA